MMIMKQCSPQPKDSEGLGTIRPRDIVVLAQTLYGEARGEWKHVGLTAFIAVGNVVVNRWRQKAWFGKTVEEVCLKPWQFSCWNVDDPNRVILEELDRSSEDALFKICLQTAEGVLLLEWPDLTKGADHYYADTLLSPPEWARQKTASVHLGHHIFFQLGP